MPSRSTCSRSEAALSVLLDALQARAGEFISLRRDFHRHPEPAFEAHRAATLVRGHGQQRLGIRADLEAPPMDPATGLAHAGVMRAWATTATRRCCRPRCSLALRCTPAGPAT